jgi:hypothetical protein
MAVAGLTHNIDIPAPASVPAAHANSAEVHDILLIQLIPSLLAILR